MIAKKINLKKTKNCLDRHSLTYGSSSSYYQVKKSDMSGKKHVSASECMVNSGNQRGTSPKVDLQCYHQREYTLSMGKDVA